MGSGDISHPSTLGERGPDPRALGQPKLSVCQPRHDGWLVQIGGICITEQWRGRAVPGGLAESDCGLKGPGLDHLLQALHNSRGTRFWL